MLSNINISELKAKTIYHIYIMIQIKKATLLKNNKKPIIPEVQIRQFYSLLKKRIVTIHQRKISYLRL